MIDLETLSTAKNALVLSAGIVLFDPYGQPGVFNKTWHEALDLDEQVGGQMNLATVTDFWFKYPEAATRMYALRAEGLGKAANLHHQINYWAIQNPKAGIWANSPSFDLEIVRNLFERLKLPVPWNFWQERDVRTIRQMHDVAYPDVPTQELWGVAHDALFDAKQQAYNIQSVFGG